MVWMLTIISRLAHRPRYDRLEACIRLIGARKISEADRSCRRDFLVGSIVKQNTSSSVCGFVVLKELHPAAGAVRIQ